MDQHKLITTLIKDNLLHTRLLIGFKDLGFQRDNYCLHLSDLIFELLEIDSNQETYLKPIWIDVLA